MIAENFNFLWKLHKDKQTELAKMFCVPQSNISDYVNGKRDIPIDVLDKIAYRYGVTIDDLKNKDLSFEYDSPQSINIEQAIDISQKMFPLFTSNIAKTNDSFNRAYEITMIVLRAEDVNTINSKLCIFEHAIELYQKAWEESKTHVALSNAISLILLIFAFFSQRNIDIAQTMLNKGKIDNFEIRQILLRDPRKPDAINQYEDKRKAFFEKYYDLVFENIKILKRNIKFSDLGDFYLSMCYFQGFTNCEYDYNKCVETALMMLLQQFEIGNHYAEKFLECYIIIDNLDN